MKIHFFGKLGEMVCREVHIEAPPEGYSVRELRELLARSYPHANTDLLQPSLRACVDDILVDEQFLVEPTGKVEFFPPLSGG